MADAGFVRSFAMSLRRDGGHSVSSAARHGLAQWAARLGGAGIAAMRVAPALLAQVDQHAAHVRDALSGRPGGLHPISLAAYADGVADAATRHGWSWEEVRSGDWARASWPSVRLLAVCVLADAAT